MRHRGRDFHEGGVTAAGGYRNRGHARDRANFRRRVGALVHAMGAARDPPDPRAPGVPGRGEPPPAAAARRAAAAAAVARPRQSARIRRAHDAAHAHRPWGCRCSSPSPMRRLPPRTSAPNACWCRCSTSCSRCRSSASSRSPWCSSCRWRPAACSAPSSPPIFAIFTSQAWNMAFSFYQSLRTVPAELVEASRSLPADARGCASGELDVPFAMPQLIWNMMMSMSGGWFFVVASEAISVGNTTVHAARRRLLHRARHRAAESGGDRLGDRHHADRHPDLRPAAVPAAGGVGRPLPLRAGGRRPAAALLGARRAAPLAAGRPADAAVLACCGARSMRRALRSTAAKPTSRPRAMKAAGRRSICDRRRSSRSALVALWQIVRFVTDRRQPRRRGHDVPARPRHPDAGSSC